MILVAGRPARSLDNANRAAGEFQLDESRVVGVERLAVPLGDGLAGGIDLRERAQVAARAFHLAGDGGGHVEDVAAEVAEHTAGAGGGLESPQKCFLTPMIPHVAA